MWLTGHSIRSFQQFYIEYCKRDRSLNPINPVVKKFHMRYEFMFIVVACQVIVFYQLCLSFYQSCKFQITDLLIKGIL